MAGLGRQDEAWYVGERQDMVRQAGLGKVVRGRARQDKAGKVGQRADRCGAVGRFEAGRVRCVRARRGKVRSGQVWLVTV